MADWSTCLNWLLDNEDSQRAYAIVPDAGGQAISGVNSKAWPESFAAIAALPQGQRGPAIADFYWKNYWNEWLDQIQSNEVAKRYFDATVNMGTATATKLFQQAADWTVDGILGPMTVERVNILGDALVEPFKAIRAAHYKAIVVADPSKAQYLEGWLARAEA